MSGGDRVDRDSVNILVNCPKESMFIESDDASLVSKTTKMLVQFLDKYVESVASPTLFK